MHRGQLLGTVLALVAVLTPALSEASPLDGGPLCLPVTPTAAPKPAKALRFGVDVGLAGNLVPVTVTPPPAIDTRKESAALAGLRPRKGRLVVRLNRLFWSGGEPLLQQFAVEARRYGRAGYDVEVQVRYHPATEDIGDVAGYTAWVRHVVDVLGANPHLVALTITNEVNFTVSPNTSDGFYPGSSDALVQGIVAAGDQLSRHRWAGRVKVGFTYAYRFNPVTDRTMFTSLASAGPAFHKALGFVGLDVYPGTVYPPAIPPGSTPASEMASAIATLRTCYLPLGGIPATVPIWITENGFGSNAPQHSEAQQASALTGMIAAARAVGGSYNVTDYRWFNLRDNDSGGSGTFDQDGLVRDDYTRKPSYAAFVPELRR